MIFNPDCRVIARWGHDEQSIPVTSKAAAWREARTWLLKGYAVGFSSALIEAMRR